MSKKIVDKRPWGKFEQFTANEKSTVKLLYVKKGKRLSYQYHKGRSEFWHVVSGKIVAVLNGRRIPLRAGGEITIPKMAKHRIIGVEDAVVLELASGKFDENDIVRIEDDFNRK